jgi:hypothetical protein
MPAHSRSKNGVASLAYVAGIHAFSASFNEEADGRSKAGHNERGAAFKGSSRPPGLASHRCGAKRFRTSMLFASRPMPARKGRAADGPLYVRAATYC